MIFTYDNLPKNDNLNRFSYCLEVERPLLMQKGKTIAYYGTLRFESLGRNLMDKLVQESFGAPLYLDNFIVATGTGKLILGDRGRDLASYDLEDAHFTLKRDRVLGFSSSLVCQESVLPGYLTFLGTG